MFRKFIYRNFSTDVETFLHVALIGGLCLIAAMGIVVSIIYLIMDPGAASGATFGFAG